MARPSPNATSLAEPASPLYEQVKDFVIENIGSGRWTCHARLPSEHELVSALGVSRMTIHRALRELTAAGHLRRIQGVGTFVAPPRPQSTLIEISSIAAEIAARGGLHRAEVVALERVEHPQADLLIAFEFGSRRPVDHSIVLHFENDVPVQLEERYVNPGLVSGYLEQDFSAVTTFDYLQNATPLTEVEHLISALSAGPETARLLRIQPAESCLVLHRKTWTGSVVATVNTFTYVGSRYALGSRYRPGNGWWPRRLRSRSERHSEGLKRRHPSAGRTRVPAKTERIP